MADNVLSIGAVVDTKQLAAGLEEARGSVKDAVNGIAIDFEGLSAKSTNAWNAIGDSVKQASRTVSEESLAAARAAEENMAAQRDLRRALVLVRDANVPAAESTAVLAAAQDAARGAAARLGEANAAVAEAARAASTTSIEAGEEMATGWRAAAASVMESMDGIQERLVGTAEKAELSADGIAAGFGGLGKLLGLGIAGEFFGRMIDDTAKANVEIGDLAETTGIAVQSLAGLKQIAISMGLSFNSMSKVFQRISAAQVSAANESTDARNLQVKAFHDIGISMDEVVSKNPEEMFYRLAQAIHNTSSKTLQQASAYEILGRSSASTLLPIFDRYGDQLESLMKKQGALTGDTRESVEASRQWLEMTADLSAEIHSLLIPVLEHIVPLIRDIGHYFTITMTPAALFFEETIAGAEGLGRVLGDALSGKFGALVDDAESAAKRMKDIFLDNLHQVRDAANGFHWTPDWEKEKGPGTTDLRGIMPQTQQMQQMKRWNEQFKEFTSQSHAVTIAEEIRFWQKRADATEKGGENWIAIEEKIGKLQQKASRPHRERVDRTEVDAARTEYSEMRSQQEPAREGEGQAQYHLQELQEDLAFWQKKAATAKAGSALALEARKQGLALQREVNEAYRRAVEETAKAAAADAKKDAADLQHALVDSAKQAIEKLKDLRKQAKELLQGQHEQKLDALQYQAEQVQSSYEIGEASGGDATGRGKTQELETLRAIHQQEIAEDERFITEELAAYQGSVAGRIALENRLMQVQQRGRLEELHDTTKITMQIEHQYTKVFESIRRNFQTALNGWLQGTQTLAQAFGKMGNAIVLSLAENLAEMALKWAQHETTTVLMHTVANQAKVTSDGSAAVQSEAISAASTIRQMTHYAALAAAKAFSALADIPIVGPALGAAAAGTTFAAVMALEAFEQGGVVQGVPGMSVPILAHAGERVLTPAQTQNFESMVNNDNRSNRGGNTLHANVEQHFHGGKASSAKETQAAIRGLMRNGKLGWA